MSIPGSASPLFFQTAAAADTTANIIKSVRFNRADSPYLNRTPSSAGNTQTWTWSGWVKFSTDPNDLGLFAGDSATSRTQFRFKSHLLDFVVEGVTHRRTAAFFRDPSAWYHIVWAFDSTQSTASNRSRLYINGVEITDFSTNNTITQNQTTGINSTNAQVIGATSTTPDDEFDGYMADVYLIDGQQLDCTSFGAFDDNGVWQPAAYSGSFGTNGFHLFDFANESGIGNDSSGNDNDFTVNNISAVTTNGSYTGGISVGNYTLTDYDKNSVVDGRLSGGGSFYADRPINNNGLNFSSIPQASTSVRIYASLQSGTLTTNGGDIATGSTSAQWLTVSTTYPFTLTYIRASGGNSGDGFFIYAIEVDGTVLVDNRFGTGDDVFRDVPTNGDASDDTGAGGELSSNYATLNPLAKGTSLTMTNGNLALDQSVGGWDSAYSTIFLPSGKWYAEFTIRGRDSTNSYGILVGLAGDDTYIVNSEISSGNTYAVQNMGSMVKINHNGGSTNIENIGHYAVGDVLQLAYDADNGKLWFGRNNTWINSGNPSSGTNATQSSISGTYCFAVALLHTGDKIDCNFGQRGWAYSAPTNFKAVCTSNLATPTIADGSAYFEAKTYTGNGSTQTISGFEFSPDLVWLKSREDGEHHGLFDTQRGALYRLVSDYPYASTYRANTVTSFNSDGFSLGSAGEYNGASSETHIAWAWDAGTSNASNTDGDVTSTVRANQTAGFSIVTWTGVSQTNLEIGHGLGAEPYFMMVKKTNLGTNWVVYHKSIGNTHYLRLDGTLAATDSSVWGDTTPTSSVFTVNSSDTGTGTDDTYIAYCFAPVAGYSAFGEFNSTNAADNAFVYTGFKPRFLLWKKVDDTGSWGIYDAARNPSNAVNKVLLADSANAESTLSTAPLDFLSNGFKVRDTLGTTNDLVYMCFAENPFQANGGLAR